MIVIGGLTPAWQHILVFDEFRFGTVNRAKQTVRCASGKVLNAALAAYHLNGYVRVLAAVGGRTRRQIEDDLEAFDLDYRWVVTEAPTRVCVTVIDRATGEVTELVEEAAPLTSTELEQFFQAWREETAKATVALLIGSLPPGTDPQFYRRLVSVCRGKAILDFSGPGLRECLALRPFLVKPNRQELARTLEHPMDSPPAIWEGIRQLRDWGAEWVLVTDGGSPAWLGGPEGLFCVTPASPTQKVNPIGSGDALAGALATALWQGKDLLEAVRFGMGAAADNLEQLLPCRLRPSRVAELASQVVIQPAGL